MIQMICQGLFCQAEKPRARDFLQSVLRILLLQTRVHFQPGAAQGAVLGRVRVNLPAAHKFWYNEAARVRVPPSLWNEHFFVHFFFVKVYQSGEG